MFKLIDASISTIVNGFSLGMLHLKTGSEDKAFAALGKCLTTEQHYIPGVLAIASILQTHGDFDVALSKYR